ncbi:hypothetical protein C7212DRAFT_342392 [Tuber magnatum]|uniref:Uncharacterized protein n=1 Tax=Tuber magnatum TaxID=42249 RepID=A0A317SXR9_9PEZI|nr:hypothetical protein C7212DRAFT_342392 [Tuber magnatum]
MLGTRIHLGAKDSFRVYPAQHENCCGDRLSDLNKNPTSGFQQTIVDKTFDEEALQQRRLTEATVVTSETVLLLREEWERVDVAKTAWIANRWVRLLKTVSAARTAAPLGTSGGERRGAFTLVMVEAVGRDEVEDLWEAVEELEVGGESGSEDSGGVIGDVIRVRRRH